MTMDIFDALETERRLPYARLIQRMGELFAAGVSAPPRHHHTMPGAGAPDATLLLMPAWNDDLGCVKIVTAYPGNADHGLPAIAGTVLVFDRATGAHRALLEGTVLTARRTAAASALAARTLAAANARTLLILGAGRVAAELPAAFSAVREIDRVLIWNRSRPAAERLVQKLAASGFQAEVAGDLPDAVAKADIISAATLATEPVLRGAWLRPGQHVDLIGAFLPTMREADDEALRRGRLFIDTETALAEAGELAIPIANAVISKGQIAGDLIALTTGAAGRATSEDITIFKSVGNAVMDLAAALTAMEESANHG